jgi:transcriptional regulator with XRE-family HTH domain
VETGGRYGALLRRRREDSGKSMGALARHLGVSTPYLSDVELGRRAPLTPSKNIAAATFLQIDPQELLLAALESRAAIEIKTPATQAGRAAVASFQRRSEEFTDQDWQDFDAWLQQRGK